MIDSYDKLSIAKYRELMDLDKTDEMQYSIDILAILSEYTEDELMEMPLDDFSALMSKTNFLYKQVDKIDWKHLGNKLTINGKKYTIIKNAKKMTAGQYIDYKSYINNGDFIKMLPYILTVFIIPDGCKYGDGYDVEELANELNNSLSIKMALCISDFFLHQSKLSMLISIRSLRWMMKRMTKKEKNQETIKQIQTAMEQMELLENSLNSSDGYTQPLRLGR